MVGRFHIFNERSSEIIYIKKTKTHCRSCVVVVVIFLFVCLFVLLLFFIHMKLFVEDRAFCSRYLSPLFCRRRHHPLSPQQNIRKNENRLKKISLSSRVGVPHSYASSANVGTVQFLNGLFAFFFGAHRHETKSPVIAFVVTY